MSVKGKAKLSQDPAVSPVHPDPSAASPAVHSPTTARTQTTPLSIIERKAEILRAVEKDDLQLLKALSAQPGGFLTDELRRTVWPYLLGCDIEQAVENDCEGGVLSDNAEPASHKDESQVHMDVIRSFINYPNDITAERKEDLRADLEEIIVTVLRRHPALSYFQGYHDIVSVVQLVFDHQQLAIRAIERMSLHRIRDNMGKGLEPVLGYLKLLHRILDRVNPDLSEIVSIAASLPYFSLSWVLTLMCHDLTSLDVISRLFDFLLSHNPAMVSYLGVAIILLKKEELANLDEDSIDDPAMLHHTLSKVPKLYLPDPSPPSPGAIEEDDDEDLMSSSLPPPSDTLSSSYATSTSSASFITEDLTDETGSTSGLSDSLLSDPDIYGPAFTHPTSPFLYSPIKPRIPAPLQPWEHPVSLEALITRTLELYERYPLVGEDGINADEIMGPKSCIFTWPLSVEGRLTAEEAEKIVGDGVDIVLPEVLETTKEEAVKEEEVRQELVEERKRERRRRRGRDVGMGTVLLGVGVVVVVLAVYSGGGVKGVKERLGVGKWF